MASMVMQVLGKRTLKSLADKNIKLNKESPYEEKYEILENGRPTGKFKTRKRGIPPGLSPNDTKILKKVRKRAYHLDMSLFNCCGIRFGWSSVIGIIPVIGDFIDMFFALMLVKKCNKVDGGLPKMVTSKMMFNIMVDFGLGLVPFIGDIADAVFRANTQNARILEEYLKVKSQAEAAGQVTDPDLGTTVPVKKPPAVLHPPGHASVRAQPGFQGDVPYTNSQVRHHDTQARMAGHQQGVEPMASYHGYDDQRGAAAYGVRYGGRGPQGAGQRGKPSREDLAMAGLQFGVEAMNSYHGSGGRQGGAGYGGAHGAAGQQNMTRPGKPSRQDLAMAGLQFGAEALNSYHGNDGRHGATGPGGHHGAGGQHPPGHKGKTAKEDLTMAALSYGAEFAMEAHQNRKGKGAGSHPPKGAKKPMSKEAVAMAALKFGAQVALDAHGKKSGRR